MSKTLEFYFDFGSPAAYLAYTQLPAITKAANAELIYKPALLGGIFQATKNATPAAIPAKGAYMLRDLSRFAQRYGVPFKFNPFFPVNTLGLMRMAIGMQHRHPDQFLHFVNGIYQATWVDGVNVGNAEILGTAIAAMDLDPSLVMALAQDEEIKTLLKSETEVAVKRGLFGMPTMFVGKEMFWGQDRLDFVREALGTA